MDRADAAPEGILRLRVVYRPQQPSYTLWSCGATIDSGRLDGSYPGDARVLVFLRRMTYES